MMDGDVNTKEKAIELWKEGTEQLLSGDVDGAIETFTESLEIVETAESYTFRGWAYSFQGRFKEAIEECKKAIAVDPSFGNPYNDIGSYLIHLGKITEAIGWFEKAKRADRYEPRHFPYLNLGRVYFLKGEMAEAVAEFEHALALDPENTVALAYLEKMRLQIN
jgi:Tfp pilus assembly protein PilF